MSHQYSFKFCLGQRVMYTNDPVVELTVKEIRITDGGMVYLCSKHRFGDYLGDSVFLERELSAQVDKDSHFPILISTRDGTALCMTPEDVPTVEPFEVLHTKVKVLGK